MYFKNGFTFCQVREFNVYLAVKATRSQKGPVEDISPVCGGKNDYTHVGAESIHLCKKLIKCIFTFIIGAKIYIPSPGPAYSVNLIDENNAWRLFLCLLEEIPHP